MANKQKSLAMWEKYGKHLLMAMPYADGLIEEARGCTIRDMDGNEILDLAAGQFCSIVGHNHPELIARIVEQTQKVVHTGTQYLSPVVLEAAGKFAEVAPGSLNKSIFFSTGTEANECAISLAKMYTGKNGIIGFNRGYYGLSLTTKSLTSIFGNGRHGDLPMVPESYRFLAPHCFRCPVKSKYPECDLQCLLTSIEAALRRNDDIAAIIIEPVISAGGMIVPPPGYLKALKAFAEEHEALLIIDEAQTGFGRTGKWFAVEHHDVEPDILVVSKGAGGGFAVSGLITTDEIADRVTSAGFSHLASHQSDPVAAAAIAAVIDIVRSENLRDKAAENGSYLMAQLRELQRKHPVILDVRGQGLMVGVELSQEKSSGGDPEIASRVVALCERNRVHLTYSYFEPVLRFIPPLTLTREEIDRAIAVLDGALSQAIQADLHLEEQFENPYTRSYVKKMTGRKTFQKILSRLYETSPEYWLKKLRDTVKS